MTRSISRDILDKVTKDFNDADYSLVQRSVTANGVYKASENVFLDNSSPMLFSNEIETGKVGNQVTTGSCWLFASLSFLRHRIEKDFGLTDFELSQNYCFFWSKLEKCNAFYDDAIATASDQLDERYVDHIFTNPQGDGSWWDMASSIIKKYGVVPSNIMPNNIVMLNSAELNKVLNAKLRKDGLALRKMLADKKSATEIDDTKNNMLSEVYRILAISLGTPPKMFDFTYKTKKKPYNIDRHLTPLDFYNKYCRADLDQYVCIGDDQVSYRKFLGYYHSRRDHIVGDKTYGYVNTGIDIIRDMVIKQIKKGEPVVFSCDVRMNFMNGSGHMSLDALDFNKTFNIDIKLDKSSSLEIKDTDQNHMMLITGVDIIDGKVTRYKVENSWGGDKGKNGYFVMSSEWFDRYCIFATINKKLLPKAVQKAYSQTPELLQPWDPMC